MSFSKPKSELALVPAILLLMTLLMFQRQLSGPMGNGGWKSGENWIPAHRTMCQSQTTPIFGWRFSIILKQGTAGIFVHW
jgi:hypothetical protein